MRRLAGILLLIQVAGNGQAAFAQHTFVAGIGIGSSHVQLGRFNEDDSAFQLFGGYRFREEGLPLRGTLGVEFGYSDLGSPKGRPFGETLTMDITALKVFVSAARPFGDRWSILGKLGAVSWKQDVSVAGLTGSNDDIDLAAGIGFEFRADGPLGIRGEIEGFDFLDGVWLYSVSAVYRFGER